MKFLILRTALYLILLSPIIFFNRKKTTNTIPFIVLFVVFVFINSILLGLPGQYNLLKLGIADLEWNWFGKLYAVIGSVLFIIFFKDRSFKSFFITTKQNPKSLRASIIVLGLVVVFSVVLAFLGDCREMNAETLLFQLTMPGLDEEIAFRGIMLGLLLPVLNDKIRIGKLKLGNPAILITAVLFGLVHSLFITEGVNLELNLGTFISTGNYGYILAWLTKKSGSILFPIIIHNLGNFLPFFITMIVL